ncbi:MAG: SOS response-associated peptidase [Pseudohongiellaceae bacterium]|nr:SOS response-associated peptidase [Pseudohongiellaceae bacterium]
MCGRYVPPDEAALERFWQVDRRNWEGWVQPLFNIAPTSRVPIIIQDDDGCYESRGARWGLIPHWWKKDTPPALTFNARSEEAAQKPTWRSSLKSQRCLMPARGWYEWNEKEKLRNTNGRLVKQPYFFYSEASPVIAFAGLWAIKSDEGSADIVSCALLSKEAAATVSHLHHRMPVVLREEDFAAWLDPETSEEEVESIIARAREDFVAYRVSTDVNNTRNDYPELLDKVASSNLF